MKSLKYYHSHFKKTESNIRIHTFEENEWNIKGKYNTALEDDDEISWMVIGKDNVLPIWLVSIKSDFHKNIYNLFWTGKRSTIGGYHTSNY